MGCGTSSTVVSCSAVPAPGFVGLIAAALNIIMWAVLTIVMIYFVFMLISCLLSFGGGLHLR